MALHQPQPYFKFLFALCLLLSGVLAVGQTLKFGRSGLIEYQQNTGTYDVFVGGKQVLKNGYAAAVINGQIIKSTDFKNFSFTKQRFQNSIGKGQLYIFSSKTSNGIVFQQLFYAFTHRDYFLVELVVTGNQVKTNSMFPLKGTLVGPANFKNYHHLFVPFDNDTFISYEANLLQPNKENTSAEVTSIYTNESRDGYVVGTLDHTVWKTGVRTKLIGNELLLTINCGFTDSNITRDKLPHGQISGASVSSSKVLFGYFKDWRLGMEDYAKAVIANEKPIVFDWKGPTPVGWNSWGVMQEKLSFEKAIKVVDFFANQLKTFRIGEVCYIDLDSYWDNLVRDNDYSTLKKFTAYCKNKGLKPGIYWAPFTDWGFKSGPNRKTQGSNYTFGEMWTKINDGFHDFDGARALDPTHPGTQKRMEWMINNFKDCGFEMIKIDFLGHAAVESSAFFDPEVTTGMQAYKVGMEHLLKCLDGKMLVYAAISPNLASSRYVHVRRIACDAFKSIKDTEYTLNSVTNGWWQTYLYRYIDADHVVLANESEEANISRILSAIVTGTFIVGDDFSRDGAWQNKAQQFFQNQELLTLLKDGKAFRPVESSNGKGAAEQFIKKVGKIYYLALFNYSKGEVSANINFSRLGFSKAAIVRMENVVTHQKVELAAYQQQTLKATEAKMLKIILK